MAIALTASGVTKTNNNFFIVHFSFNSANYVVAVRSSAEFYIEAMRAISGVGQGSQNDVDLLDFTKNTLATKLAGTVNFDTNV